MNVQESLYFELEFASNSSYIIHKYGNRDNNNSDHSNILKGNKMITTIKATTDMNIDTNISDNMYLFIILRNTNEMS